MELSLLVLRCSSIDESKRFYELFGMTFIQEQHGGGPVHYSSNSLGFVLELYPIKNKEVADNCRLGLNVGRVPSGVEVVSSYSNDGKLINIVQDPDGRKIEIGPIYAG